MATDVGVGDIEVPTLDVTPGDETTVGVLTVTAPDGTETSPAVTTGTPASGAVRLTADPVTYTGPGRWVLHWSVTGTGAGAEDQLVYVVAPPTAGGPTWTPGRARVAAYLPGRTLVRAAGANSAEHTFTATTNPPGVTIDRLIADAVAWVAGTVGTVSADLYDLASACAAVYAASNVELGYPDREVSVKSEGRNVAEDLYRRALAMRDDLVAANSAAGETPGSGALLPIYSFPAAPAWGDTLL